MEQAEPDFAALGEAVVFLDYFKDTPDPRQRGKVMYRKRRFGLIGFQLGARQFL